MIIRSIKKVQVIKADLLDSLKKEHAFWSYAPESVSLNNIT